MVPPFQEHKSGQIFLHFKKIAANLCWPLEGTTMCWPSEGTTMCWPSEGKNHALAIRGYKPCVGHQRVQTMLVISVLGKACEMYSSYLWNKVQGDPASIWTSTWSLQSEASARRVRPTVYMEFAPEKETLCNKCKKNFKFSVLVGTAIKSTETSSWDETQTDTYFSRLYS